MSPMLSACSEPGARTARTDLPVGPRARDRAATCRRCPRRVCATRSGPAGRSVTSLPARAHRHAIGRRGVTRQLGTSRGDSTVRSHRAGTMRSGPMNRLSRASTVRRSRSVAPSSGRQLAVAIHADDLVDRHLRLEGVQRALVQERAPLARERGGCEHGPALAAASPARRSRHRDPAAGPGRAQRDRDDTRAATRRSASPRKQPLRGHRDQRQHERDRDVGVPRGGGIGAEEVGASPPGGCEEEHTADCQCHGDREVAIERPARHLPREPCAHRDHDDRSERREPRDVAQGVGDAVPDELRHAARCRVGDLVGITPERDEPRGVDDDRDGQGAGCDAPTAGHERDETEHDEQREGDPRAHHRDREQPGRDRVAPGKASRCGHDDEGTQPERERGHERDLPRGEEVLRAGPEDGEHRTGTGRDPGVDACSDHEVPEQDDDREVSDDHECDVRPVRRDADDRVQRAEREDRNRGPVLVERLERALVARSVGEPAVGDHEPLVAAEPHVAVLEHEHAGRGDDHAPQREPSGSRVRGARRSPNDERRGHLGAHHRWDALPERKDAARASVPNATPSAAPATTSDAWCRRT